MLNTILNSITRFLALGVVLCALGGAVYPEVFAPLSGLTPYLLGLVMLGMGLGLTLHDFTKILSRPLMVLLGVGLQFTMMPAIAWTLAQGFNLPPELAVGLILVGCCPGGTASNVLTYLAKGDVALSVSLTVCTTLLAPLLTPTLVWLLAHGRVDVNFWSMMLDIIRMVIAPVALGVFINTVWGKFTRSLQHFMPAISALTVMILVGIVVSLSAEKLYASSAVLILAVVMHNGLGLMLTNFIARMLHCRTTAVRTLAIEIGTQNSGLAVVLALLHFNATAAIVGALFSVIQNLSGSIYAAYCRKHQSAECAAVKADLHS